MSRETLSDLTRKRRLAYRYDHMNLVIHQLGRRTSETDLKGHGLGDEVVPDAALFFCQLG